MATPAKCQAPTSRDARHWQGAWSDKTVFVLASGTSLTLETVDLVRAYASEHRIPTIAVHSSFLLAKWADVLFCANKSWWLHYQMPIRRTFDGVVATTANILDAKVTTFLNGRIPNYDDTGAQAVALAVYMGASRIILLGVDGGEPLQRWHSPHPAKIRKRQDDRNGAWSALARDTLLPGIEIVNANPLSAYPQFPKVDLADCLSLPMPVRHRLAEAPPDPPRPAPERHPTTADQLSEIAAWKGRWEGKTVFVLASGPSLTVADVEAVRSYAHKHDCPVAVTNTTYQLAPWADLLFFFDAAWWRVHSEEVLRSFPGAIVTVSESKHPRVLSMRGQRFSDYRNSGGASISFSMYAGSKRIILLGLDGKPAADGRRHWHVQDRRLGNAMSLPKFVKNFPVLANDARAKGVTILNATRDTALTCFQQVTLESILTPQTLGDH